MGQFHEQRTIAKFKSPALLVLWSPSVSFFQNLQEQTAPLAFHGLNLWRHSARAFKLAVHAYFEILVRHQPGLLDPKTWSVGAVAHVHSFFWVTGAWKCHFTSCWWPEDNSCVLVPGRGHSPLRVPFFQRDQRSWQLKTQSMDIARYKNAVWVLLNQHYYYVCVLWFGLTCRSGRDISELPVPAEYEQRASKLLKVCMWSLLVQYYCVIFICTCGRLWRSCSGSPLGNLGNFSRFMQFKPSNAILFVPSLLAAERQRFLFWLRIWILVLRLSFYQF